MEAYAIRCASGGMVFVLWNPFELYESDQLYFMVTLTPAEMKETEGLVPATSWKVAAPEQVSSDASSSRQGGSQ